MLFENAYAEYLVFASKRQKKQGFDSLKYNFNSKILPYFKGKDIYELTPKDIVDWQEKITLCNYSNNYNRNLHFMLSGFLSYCCNFLNLSHNPAHEAGSFKKHYEKPKSDFYTFKEFKKFIKYVDHIIYKNFFILMFFTGARPGEAMALKFSDLRKYSININKTMMNHGKRDLDSPKNKTSFREIQIDRKLYNDLLELKKHYIKKYNDYEFDYFIFGGKKPIAPSTINRYKMAACNKANIRPITLHQFRHSHATLLLHNGIIINEISKRLGHSKVSITLDVYTHTNSLQEKRVIKTLNSMRFNFFDLLLLNLKNFISILKHK